MKSMEEMMKAAQEAAQQVQTQMEEAQKKLDSLEVEGQAGGGLVKVKATAKGRILSVSIDDSLMKADEKEIVEDLIVAASADARAKSEKLVEEKAKALTGGLPLPPGMKLF